MKVILNYDEATGQLTDANGLNVTCWMGLNYEPLPETQQQSTSAQVDGEQLIRIMKLAAHISEPDKVASI